MNIFKKFKLATKLIKTYSEVKEYFDTNHITDEVKQLVNSLKNDIKKLAELVPALQQSVVDILEILK